ncbi:hypothetical protein BV898_10414 [Hypsibius exemplaris]|uniref:Uncharacterized protein n=1 Tax=Hypsibius exemplaris TaxID=2072580 RepID=A0A1W0WJM4_HYPEX|nr:hypothetical protein BV898_10414 [Hypsibius exemplaris]
MSKSVFSSPLQNCFITNCHVFLPTCRGFSATGEESEMDGGGGEELDSSAILKNNNAHLDKFDPCVSFDSKSVLNFRQRLDTFTTKKWKSTLNKSATCNPAKMAVNWFCCGPSSARCFACFKELEGWEPTDDPQHEHTKHCPNCPLVKLNLLPGGLASLSWRQQTRLDIAIEFARKRVMAERAWTDAVEASVKMRDELVLLKDSCSSKLPLDDEYAFRDENHNPWETEL